MTYSEISNRFSAHVNECNNTRSLLKAKAALHREQAGRHMAIAARKLAEADRKYLHYISCYPDWTDGLVRPVVQEVCKRPGLSCDLNLSTFGLRNECPVFLKDERGETVASLTFTPCGNCGVCVDTGVVDYHGVAPGSIAELNGLHHQTIAVTSIEMLVEIVRKQINRRVN